MVLPSIVVVVVTVLSWLLLVVLQRRGQTVSASGDVDGAIKDLTKALELSPSDMDVLNQRGE